MGEASVEAASLIWTKHVEYLPSPLSRIGLELRCVSDGYVTYTEPPFLERTRTTATTFHARIDQAEYLLRTPDRN